MAKIREGKVPPTPSQRKEIERCINELCEKSPWIKVEFLPEVSSQMGWKVIDLMKQAIYQSGRDNKAAEDLLIQSISYIGRFLWSQNEHYTIDKVG